MPAIQFPNQLPSWADPKNESVFDPLYKTLARRVVSGLGLDDPQSQVMQVATGVPMAVGVPEGSGLIDKIMSVAKKKLSPAAQEVTRMLYEFNPQSETNAELNALASRVTPKRGLPEHIIKAPEGFTFAGDIPKSEPTPANVRNNLWREAVKPVPKAPMLRIGSSGELGDVAPSLLTGKDQLPPPPPSSRRIQGPDRTNLRYKTNRLNVDSVRRIREIGNINDVVKEFPDINRATLMDALSGDTWAWVKPKK